MGWALKPVLCMILFDPCNDLQRQELFIVLFLGGETGMHRSTTPCLKLTPREAEEPALDLIERPGLLCLASVRLQVTAPEGSCCSERDLDRQ